MFVLANLVNCILSGLLERVSGVDLLRAIGKAEVKAYTAIAATDAPPIATIVTRVDNECELSCDSLINS